MKIGDTVRHPSRGTGTVSTVVYNPLTRRPHKAWVEFPYVGLGVYVQKFICFTDDLTLVPELATPPGRPRLAVIDVGPSAA